MIALAHRHSSNMPDMPFTLGKGHMLSCLRYGAHLANRHQALVTEMVSRGYKPSMGAVVVEQFPVTGRYEPSQEWIEAAAILVRERIEIRLSKILNQ